LYIVESEGDQKADIRLADAVPGITLRFALPAERAALALIDKKTKQIVATYGF